MARAIRNAGIDFTGINAPYERFLISLGTKPFSFAGVAFDAAQIYGHYSQENYRAAFESFGGVVGGAVLAAGAVAFFANPGVIATFTLAAGGAYLGSGLGRLYSQALLDRAGFREPEAGK